MRFRFLLRLWNRFLRLLYRRSITILGILLGVGIVGTLFTFSSLSSNIIEVQALENTKAYAQALTEARTLYSSEVVSRLKDLQIPVTHDYVNQSVGIPLPVTYLIALGDRLSKDNPGFSVRLYSDYPFPWRKDTGGPQDSFETEALQFLKQNPDKVFARSEVYQGLRSFRYAQADLMKASCIDCHNSHVDSPKKDWKVGDVRGILTLSQPIEVVARQVDRGLQGLSVLLAFMGSLSILGMTIVISKLRNISKDLEIRVQERTLELNQEKEKSDQLLLNILPEPIANRLKDGHEQISDGFATVTILFADIVGFTPLSEQVSPDKLVYLLNLLFSEFDHLSDRHSLEKIKTIGDAYMVAGGLPDPNERHAAAIADMALDMLEAVQRFNRLHDTSLDLRIGMNSGPVTAGVIGKKKFIYDLWGDAVNTASRMESHGIPGKIQVTETTYNLLADQYRFTQRGVVHIKGKGEMTTYLLEGKIG